MEVSSTFPCEERGLSRIAVLHQRNHYSMLITKFRMMMFDELKNKKKMDKYNMSPLEGKSSGVYFLYGFVKIPL